MCLTCLLSFPMAEGNLAMTSDDLAENQRGYVSDSTLAANMLDGMHV